MSQRDNESKEKSVKREKLPVTRLRTSDGHIEGKTIARKT